MLQLILHLPFGYQRRLHSLMTPAERYWIQIAYGFEENNFGPLEVFSYRVRPPVNFFQVQKVKGILHNRTEGHDPTVRKIDRRFISIETQLDLWGLEPCDFDSLRSANRVFNCFSLDITAPIIDETYLRLYSKIGDMFMVQKLYITGKLTLSLPKMFELFKGIKELIMFDGYAYNGWIRDIFNTGKRGLTGLRLYGSFEDVLSFDADDLSQLFQSQDEKFLLYLGSPVAPEDAIQRLREKYGRFEEFTYEKGYLDGAMCYRSAKPQLEIYFQIGPKPKRFIDRHFD